MIRERYHLSLFLQGGGEDREGNLVILLTFNIKTLSHNNLHNYSHSQKKGKKSSTSLVEYVHLIQNCMKNERGGGCVSQIMTINYVVNRGGCLIYIQRCTGKNFASQ